MSYNNLIDVNIAPLQSTKIGVYDSSGNKVGKIELGNLKKTGLGNKLYSFGAISDIHLQDDTAQTDFQTALAYLNDNESVAFTCICGDLTTTGSDANLQNYKDYVASYSPNTPVYGMSGNHDARNSDIASKIETYTGHPLYYSFEYQGDIFIFVGVNKEVNGGLFTTSELQWLYETLEANRNKRCFVFEHVRPQDSCGNAYGIYNYDIWGGTEQTVFESMVSHYKNVVLFHGHSHLKFNLQTKNNKANYENSLFGIHSIHIPSLAVPRTGDASGASSRQEIYADSEGYVVDVYENAIILRGRDFVNAKFLPIATYCLDTTLQTITANSYTDSTGTIDTATSHSITNNLSNATNSNTATSVARNGSYTATITANTNYSIQSIVVTMGGTDVSSSAVSGNNISISNVTGNIVITVTTVSTLNPCTAISLSASSLTFTSADTQTLTATVTPSDTTDTISWSTNNSSVATVVDGIVTPVANGSATITVTCGSKSATCSVTVNISTDSTIDNISYMSDTKLDKSTGTESVSTAYTASKFIIVDSSKTYKLKSSLTSFKLTNDSSISSDSWNISVIHYDSNKSVIGYSSDIIGKTANTTEVNIPTIANTEYIRLRIYNYATAYSTTVSDSLTITEV